MGQRILRAETDPLGDEYAVVSFRPSWGAISVGLFLVGLFARSWLPHVPLAAVADLHRSAAAVLSMALFSVLGFAAGLLGKRFATAQGAVRVGLFLNGVTLGLLALTLGTLALWWSVLR